MLLLVLKVRDQAFVNKILQLLGFRNFNGKRENLDPFWEVFIPTYPRGNDLYKRLDMPSILFTDTLSVAVYVGEGSNLGLRLSATIQGRGNNSPNYRTDISAFGIVADSDDNSPDQIAKRYHQHFDKCFPNFPDQAGIVDLNSPRTGIFVLPDNLNSGVLDTLICECGEIAYPTYMERARSYLNNFSVEERKDELRWKPFDYEKALIATVASVLMPGMTNTASISRNLWVCEQTRLQVPGISNFVNFLEQLLDLT